jgi:hypothetical protein
MALKPRRNETKNGAFKTKRARAKLWLTITRWFQRVRSWGFVCVMKTSKASLVFLRVAIWSTNTSYDKNVILY